MRFAWEGFSIEAPDDWAPATLSGNRQEGYVRLASAGAQAIQVRWKAVKKDFDLSGRLEQYRAKLRDGARKLPKGLDFESEEEGDRLLYKYRAQEAGRGALFYSAACGRVFFLEIAAPRPEGTAQPFRRLLDSFESSGPGERDAWSVLGLSLMLPPGLAAGRKQFRAGHTRIVWTAKGLEVVGERWGFGEQLLQAYALEDWARSALGLEKTEAFPGEEGVRFERLRPWPLGHVRALVRFDPERNQIVSVKSVARRAEYAPDASWFGPE